MYFHNWLWVSKCELGKGTIKYQKKYRHFILKFDGYLGISFGVSKHKFWIISKTIMEVWLTYRELHWKIVLQPILQGEIRLIWSFLYIFRYLLHWISKSLNHSCLTLSWRRPLSCRNQSTDLQSKSMDWFLYENGFLHKELRS